MAKFHIEPDQVKKVATDVSTMATSFHEMSGYTSDSQLTAAHFGKIAHESDRAGGYVARMQALGASLEKASGFLDSYAQRLNKSADLHTENEEESAWGISGAGKDV